jgi:tape measure domain-containing protein
MAEQRVGVELFLDNDQFTQEVKKTGNTFIFNTDKIEKGIKSVNSSITQQGKVFTQSAEKSVAAIAELGSESKKTNGILTQNAKDSANSFKNLGSTVSKQTGVFEKSSAEIVAAIKKIGQETKKQEPKVVNSFTKMRKAMDRAAKATFNIRNAFLGIGGTFLAKQILGVADAYTLLDSRLGLVTDSSEQFASVSEKLLNIANETRQPFANTANLYTRIARAAKALNESSDDLLGVTETLNKAIIISGANLAETTGAITQFIQGIQSGTLRGQELNSVLEQTPRIAELIAEGLGVTIGELRKLGEQGALTAQVVIDAIQTQTSAINKEFGQISKTAGQAFVVLKNEIFDVIAGTNKASGATNGLVSSIEEFTDLIRDNKGEIVEFFANAVEGAKLLEPILKGIAITLGNVALGYSKIAQVIEVIDIQADRQRELNKAYKETNRTIQQQAVVVADLDKRIDEARDPGANNFQKAQLESLTDEWTKQMVLLRSMSAERIRLNKLKPPPVIEPTSEEEVATVAKLAGKKAELVKFENEYVDALKREFDQFQLISEIAEQAVLSQLEGRELLIQEIEFETAALKTQASLKIENAEVLQATLTQIDANAAAERDLINKEFDAKDTERKKRKMDFDRKIYFDTAALAIQALSEMFGENKAFAIADIGLKTAQGIMNSFANLPPPLNFIQAGLIGAIGGAQIAKASQQKFEHGGVVQGQSRTGDKIQVGANAGEMFINEQQQSNLLAMLDGGGGKREIIVISDVFSSEEVAQKIVNNNALAERLGLEAMG